ncbi:MAG: glycosyltransferase [Candidatus Hodarchaeales archaeon]
MVHSALVQNNGGSIKFFIMVKIYNEYEMLEDLIKSLIEQKKKPVKVIIIDDGSPDPVIGNKIGRIIENYSEMKIELLQLPLKEKPNLDTVGRTFKEAWLKEKDMAEYKYVATIDADTRLEPNYYKILIEQMQHDESLGCTSGAIIVRGQEKEYIEKINIGAKVGRKDARGSGKVIRASILYSVQEDEFPEVDWDTWINTRAKVMKMKALQIERTYMYQERPTTRVVQKDLYRSGRLTYHFGYNPILLLMKIILAKKGGLTLFKGYWNARNEKWVLPDKEVRNYFGWRFFFHF